MQEQAAACLPSCHTLADICHIWQSATAGKREGRGCAAACEVTFFSSLASGEISPSASKRLLESCSMKNCASNTPSYTYLRAGTRGRSELQTGTCCTQAMPSLLLACSDTLCSASQHLAQATLPHQQGRADDQTAQTHLFSMGTMGLYFPASSAVNL